MKKVLRSSIGRAIFQITMCAIGGPIGCAAGSAAAAWANGASDGDALKAGAFSFISAGVWDVVGTAISAVEPVGQALIHGTVNGALEAAQGGNFLVGFATGALGKVAGMASQRMFGHVGGSAGVAARTVMAAAAGCAGAVISGGKCENGAISAAFAHLYNAERLKFAPGMSKEYVNIDTGTAVCLTSISCPWPEKARIMTFIGDRQMVMVLPAYLEWIKNASGTATVRERLHAKWLLDTGKIKIIQTNISARFRSLRSGGRLGLIDKYVAGTGDYYGITTTTGDRRMVGAIRGRGILDFDSFIHAPGRYRHRPKNRRGWWKFFK